MNKIQQLIQQYCPNGVEYTELGRLGVFENIGVDKKIIEGQKKVMLLNFMDVMRNKHITKEVLTMEVSASDSKIEKCDIKKFDIFITPTSETRDEIGFASVVDEDIPDSVYSYHIMRYRLYEKNNITPYFISYLFETENLRTQIFKASKGLTRYGLSGKDFGKLSIPIPPLPIQEEIVKILDSFTQLEAELEAELEARRKQYEYYRNKLLSATMVSGKWLMNGVEVQWKTLGEVCKITSGGTPSTNEKLYWENGSIPWLKSEVCKDSYLSSAKTFITELGLNNSSAKYLEIGTVLMAMVGATIFKTAYLNFRATTNQNIAGIKSIDTSILSDKFIFYFILNSYNFLTSKLSGYNMINLSQIKSIQIPIPPLAEQERIVGILDKFDALVNDISIGLPAEIDGRRKQYNYYRGKLLTFKQS